MNARSIRTAAAFAFLLSASYAHADVTRTYPVRHMDPQDAVQAVYVKVGELRGECRLMPSDAHDRRTAGVRGTFLAECKSELSFPKIDAALASIDVAPVTRRFHVAVLNASRKDGTSPDLPPGEAKALADFKKVMTYKSFEIDAEAIVQSDREVQTSLNNAYQLELEIDTDSPQSISVRQFRLRATTPVVLKTGQQTLPTYIDTSFTMKPGETIVLGTSVSDQQARVVLVTALP